MAMKLTSIDFSCQVEDDSRSSWMQTMGNQLIAHFPYIRYTNHKYYYFIIILEYVNQSQVNAHVV